jgi:hypothetical protein
MLKAARDGVLNKKDQIEIEKTYLEGASNILATATSQQEWDMYQDFASQRGVPARILAAFGNQWSPAAVARAKKLELTAKEEADVAHQQLQRGLERERIAISRQNANIASAREKRQAAADVTAGGARQGRSLTSNRRSEIQRRKHARYASLEEELRNAFTNLSTGAFSIPESVQRDVVKRKLQIENDSRAELGEAPLLDAEHAFASDPSKAEDLKRLRRTYRELTGEDTPLERMSRLARDINAERDPRRRETLKSQLKQLRNEYSSLTGR